jgi:hypothetical protein
MSVGDNHHHVSFQTKAMGVSNYGSYREEEKKLPNRLKRDPAVLN